MPAIKSPIDNSPMGAEATVYLGLGASLGDRLQNLRDAIERLNECGVRTVLASRVYASPHLGLLPGDEERYPPHLNAVIMAVTDLTPEMLLGAVHRVEAAGGRERNERWGPRTIDIDILAYDDRRVATDHLILPHPEIANRAFVVRPLLDIAPEYRLPGGATLHDLLDREPLRSQPIELAAQSLLLV